MDPAYNLLLAAVGLPALLGGMFLLAKFGESLSARDAEVARRVGELRVREAEHDR